jgi:hypothetical protein
MKKFIICSLLLVIFSAVTTLSAQDQPEEYLGLPGDNLNLYAVMKLFQDSKTLEDFEKTLNDENSRINNLDLNGDNMVDYIKVFDNVDGDVHNIVLQVGVNEKENQDIAVFTVLREPNGQVEIQLIGDEDLYGKNYIIEPIFDEANSSQTPNPGYTGNTRTLNGQNITVIPTTTVEIASWPLVRYIYLPNYVVWHSSWYWGYYPSYWRAWRPFYWHYYYGYHYNWYHDYYGHYRRWDHHRYARWNDYYYSGRRTYSPAVRVRVETGHYKDTYSRPDQRRDGEALYAKTSKDQNRRSSGNMSSGSRKSGNSAGTSSGTGRRSASDQKSVTTRRSSTTVTTKSGSSGKTEQNAGTSRRSKQTKTSTAASSGKRSSKAVKSESTSKKSSGKRSSGSGKETRRR